MSNVFSTGMPGPLAVKELNRLWDRVTEQASSLSTTTINYAATEQTFTVEPSKQFAVGQTVRAADNTDPTQYVQGTVLSYDSVTGELVVGISTFNGTGSGMDWTVSSVGSTGETGATGASAYQIALDNGFVGTEVEWLLSLKGTDGTDGDSAYEIAVAEGFSGTESEWLESLVGPEGLSAYQVAVDSGFVGTEAEWLESLVGAEGPSAYDVAVSEGFVGTEAEWLTSLNGTGGANGTDGTDGTNGTDGTDGRGIVSVVQTAGDSSPGSVDTYTITYTDATTDTFDVYNGADGAGDKGDKGDTGPANTLTVGTVTTGEAPEVTITGDAPTQTINFVLARGDKGDIGPANTLSIGTVTAGAEADATLTGAAPTQTLNLVLPKGDKGDPGVAATITVGTVTTGAPGTSVEVTNTGTADAAVLAFTIPRGDPGEGSGDMPDVEGITFNDSVAERGSMVTIYGDIWTLANARWDADDEEFYRLDNSKPAFAQHLQGQNLIPGEAEIGFLISGMNNWVAQPAAYSLIRGGGLLAGNRYGATGGWELGYTLTQERQLTIGGGGIEVDGYGTLPYGRFQHTIVNDVRRTGVMTNQYTDESGRDDPTKSSWWFGVNNGSDLDETWRVQYGPAGGGFEWQNLLSVTPAGNVTFKSGGVNLQNVTTINGNAINSALVGLGNVNNTADADKPVSTATQSQLDGKANASGANAYGAWPIDINGNSEGITIFDNRDVVDTPQNAKGYSSYWNFKSLASVGNPPVSASGSFAWIQTIAGWSSDGSGGWPIQISYGAAGAAIRQGTSTTEWTDWKKFLVEGDADISWDNLENKPAVIAAGATAADARAAIGAGTSNFSGVYADLSSKPTIPAAQQQTDWAASSGITSIANKPAVIAAGANAAAARAAIHVPLCVTTGGDTVSDIVVTSGGSMTHATLSVATIMGDEYNIIDSRIGDVTATGATQAAARAAIGAGTSDLTLGTTAGTALPGNTTVLPDAPSDGKNYVRKDAAWGEIPPAEDQTTSLTYTYTGTLVLPPTVIRGQALPASPTGKERVTGILLMPVNSGLTGIEFAELDYIAANFNLSNMPALTTLSFPELTTLGAAFNLSNIPALTTLSFPELTTVGAAFNPTVLPALTTLSFPALTAVAGNFSPSNLSALTTLSFPALTSVSNFSPNSMVALTTLSFPALTFVISNFNASSMPALTTLSFPALTAVGASFNPTGMMALTALSLPELTFVGATISVSNMGALTTLSVPKIESIYAGSTAASAVISIVSGTAALTIFELPTTLKQVGGAAGNSGNVVITSAALNQTSVDSILVRLAALDGTAGTTSFDGRTVTITGTSSTPSATGLAAKAVLQARGCTVTHN